ncbi:MAG: hypothetical protein HPY71_14020 [Firmicutes bacterium]|nr:hypothetical protein [Bacillota bacterium]
MMFPKSEIGNYNISRLICGTNCFLGFSHFSGARDAWLKRFFDIDHIVEVLEACSRQGINAILGPADQKLATALKEHEARTGRHMYWIATTYGRRSIDDEKKTLEWLREQGAEFGLIFAGYVDANLITSRKEVEGLRTLLNFSRQLGLVPGVSTHRPETINVCDEAGYDIDVYVLPLNVLGFMSPVETNWIARIIRDTPKSVVTIKPLASGRVMPEDGLRFVYASIKSTDCVAVGLMSPEEVEDDIAVARQILLGEGTDRILLHTPSKSTLK